MQTVLIVVHLLIVLALIGVVLLQRSEGGLGLGGGGSSGTGGFLTGRGQANALTRATAILAALFFLTSLTLGVLAHRGNTPRSIFDQNTAGGPPAGGTAAGANASGQPATQAPGTPSGNGVLDQLQRMQQAPVPIAPGAPSSPQAPQR